MMLTPFCVHLLARRRTNSFGTLLPPEGNCQTVSVLIPSGTLNRRQKRDARAGREKRDIIRQFGKCDMC